MADMRSYDISMDLDRVVRSYFEQFVIEDVNEKDYLGYEAFIDTHTRRVHYHWLKREQEEE